MRRRRRRRRVFLFSAHHVLLVIKRPASVGQTYGKDTRCSQNSMENKFEPKKSL